MSTPLLTATIDKLPQLTLVGAGPGDPELITLKGMRALQQADIVLYDALANEELLKYASAEVPKVYVGKRGGGTYKSQEEINELIVQCARHYGHVVRLKGGDPYIFGRGHEEQVYAESCDVAVSVVPGISSVYSVPALQSIPLTRRGISESFWVITGTTRHGSLSQDVALAAQSTATVVILMGMRQLPKIQEVFEAHGQGDTPVAIIQNGSLPEEKVGLATVSTVTDMVAEEQLGAPAIIVIGEVVREHKVPVWLEKAVAYA